MQTAFERIGVPDEIQVIIFIIALALIVGSFFPGVDFGKIKIPHFKQTSKLSLIFFGILIFFAAAVARYPAFYIPETPVLPPSFTAQSQCSGTWIFRERKICEGASQSMPSIVTDGEICGWEISHDTVQPTGYKTCRHVSHGFERFANFEEVTHQSSRRGWDIESIFSHQSEQCQIMKENYIFDNPDRDIVWRNERSSRQIGEPSIHGIPYTIRCYAVANWGPIYVRKESEACGPLDPVQQATRTPKQCVPPTELADSMKTQSAHCEWEERYNSITTINEEIFRKYSDGIVERPICMTCSEFSANARQMADCLVNNFNRLREIERINESAHSRIKAEIISHIKILYESKRPIPMQTRTRMMNIIANTQE